ncbi:activating transcription factor 3-like [Haliotis rubra]|uniref:activating transcription factor 3-like n=1 Tax=Haliotis rubra TaxID=36100 RepID=UPI001EE57D15|nr:activating transcription factor 3-like [Haliotis rubra]XP_046561986.1 activating transcription factor 3-like [Haliotis rubra]
MRETLAFELLTSIMNDDWRADSPIPSTSNDTVESIVSFGHEELRLDTSEVTIDPSYEETLQSLYSEDDSQSDPLWNPNSTSDASSTFGGDNSLDFLSQDSFLDASVTDVVKGSLKSRIHAKRLASGQEEIIVDLERPTSPKEPLTEEALQLHLERKEKNRVAAQKCRNKKRERADHLENDINRLENKQDHLKEEIQRLQDEREHLEEVINIHSVVCPKIRKISDS